MVAYGLVVSAVAAVALGTLPRFQREHPTFVGRFVYRFWRYGLPGWGFTELVLWITQHRVKALPAD